MQTAETSFLEEKREQKKKFEAKQKSAQLDQR
jgi:hypothetical protein